MRPHTHQTTKLCETPNTDGMAFDEAHAYFKEQGLEAKLSEAVNQVLHERPADAVARVAELLSQMSSSSSLKVAAASLAATQRRLTRQRQQLEAKDLMFSGLLRKSGGLPEGKVATLVTVPSISGGTQPARQAQGRRLGVGAAFCGRSVIMPLGGRLSSRARMASRRHLRRRRGATRAALTMPHLGISLSALRDGRRPAVGEAPARAARGGGEGAQDLAATWDPFLRGPLGRPDAVGALLLLWLRCPRRRPTLSRRGASTRRWRSATSPRPVVVCPTSSTPRACLLGCELGDEQLAAVEAACAHATEALRGTRCTFDRLWYVTDSDEAAMEAAAPSRAAGEAPSGGGDSPQ